MTNEQKIIEGHWDLLAKIYPLAVIDAAAELPEDDPRKNYAQEAVHRMASEFLQFESPDLPDNSQQ